MNVNDFIAKAKKVEKNPVFGLGKKKPADFCLKALDGGKNKG